MKVQIYGKVISRTQRTTDTGTVYSIVIEEPGLYPSRYQLGAKDPHIFGQPDGPTGIGKMVTATAFGNGREKEVVSKDGKKFMSYRVWFNLTALEPAEASTPSAADAPRSEDAVSEDLPF